MMLKQLLKIPYRTVQTCGLDPLKFTRALRALPTYLTEYWKFRKQSRVELTEFPFSAPYPCLSDRYAVSGDVYSHYFHQDLLVARRIFEAAPRNHADVGSRIDGFVAHVAAFRQISVIDIRPLPLRIPNINFAQADLMGELPESLRGAFDSVSCLHALEHFGLGRYGDRLDCNGHIKGFENIIALLAPKGTLYLSVPIGNQRVEFNAHRVFAVKSLLELVSSHCDIVNFSFVSDAGELVENASCSEEQIANNCGCKFGCGIVEATLR